MSADDVIAAPSLDSTLSGRPGSGEPPPEEVVRMLGVARSSFAYHRDRYAELWGH
jgi:hypothetical protein